MSILDLAVIAVFFCDLLVIVFGTGYGYSYLKSALGQEDLSKKTRVAHAVVGCILVTFAFSSLISMVENVSVVISIM